MLVLREVWIQREVPIQDFDETTRTSHDRASTEKILHSENTFGFQLLRELHHSEFTESNFGVQET